MPFQQWVLVVMPQLSYVTFLVLNLLKIPVLYFISAVDTFARYFVLLASFFYTVFLLRQIQMLFEFVCVNTILSSVNMVLLGATDYLYYF